MTGPRPDLGREIDVVALRDVAVRVAEDAATLLAEGIGRARASVETKSSATDMVTEMDRASEARIVALLGDLRPDDGIVGEEGADHPGTSGVRWVVDPLDGTTNYLYGYPGWNVSVGAEIDGVPVAGAVVVPDHREVYAGALGSGSTCNGRRLAVAEPAPLRSMLVGTGFNYDPDTRRRQATAVGELIGRIRDIRRQGAAAADLCATAIGRLDAYYEHGLAPWDWLAGTVIAREAGLRVEVLGPTPLGSDLVVAVHPSRADALLDLLDSTEIFDRAVATVR